MLLTVTYTNATGTPQTIAFQDTDTSHASVPGGPFATSADFQRAAVQYALDHTWPEAGQTQGIITLDGAFKISPGAKSSDGALVVHSNTLLQGTGSTTITLDNTGGHAVTGIIRTADGVPYGGTLSSTSNVTIKNLTIDGNVGTLGTAQEVDGFYCGPDPNTTLYHDDNIKLENVVVQNCSRYGFDPHAATTNLTFTNCTATNNKDGFTIDGCSGVTITDCTASGNWRHGFNVVTSSSDVTFTNVTASNNLGSGIVVQTGENEARTLTQNVTILGGNVTGNHLEGIVLRQVDGVYVGTDATGAANGVNVSGNYKSGILIEGSSNIAVKNNTIEGNTTAVDPTGNASDAEVNIRGYLQNFADDANATNDMFRKSDTVNVSNNTIGLTAGDTASRGVNYNTQDVVGQVITGNTFRGIDPASYIKTSGTSSNDDPNTPGVVDPVALYSYVITHTANTITGTAGNDIIAAGGGNDTVSGGIGDDVLYGEDDNDSLAGGDGQDSLLGGFGNDVLDGGAGDDTLKGGAGSDTLIGGLGIDTASYQGAAGGILITLGSTGTDGEFSVDSLDSIENVVGSSNADKITGDAGANVLDGAAGDDTLIGGAGNDTLIGGTANDWASFETSTASVTATLVTGGDGTASDGFGGNDTLSSIENLRGGSANDILTGNDNSNILFGGAGADTLIGGAGSDTASYRTLAVGVTVTVNSSDTLSAEQQVGDAQGDRFVSIENVFGTQMHDTLTGDAGVNTLDGWFGNDKLYGVGGNDVLNGGNGNDTYYLDALTYTLNEVGGIDTIECGFSYVLALGFENLTLTGTGNFDGTGNASANIFVSNSGNNRLDGQGGEDTVSYVTASGGVVVDLRVNGLGEATATGGGGSDTLISIENAVGSGFDDTIYGTDVSNDLYGGAGNDVISGGAAGDWMYGGAGDDTYYVDNYADFVIDNAGEGIDYVYVSGPDWTIAMQLATELEYIWALDEASTAAMELGGTGGANNMRGTAGVNTLYAGDGADTLYGFAGNDTLYGDDGNDTLYGGAGQDTMSGGAGDDYYYVDDELDVIYEGWPGGNDTVESTASFTMDPNQEIEKLILIGGALNAVGSWSDNTIEGTASNNELHGHGGNDVLKGFAGADTLDGGEGADSLDGAEGADSLDGGEGIDTMSGGTGADTYYVDNASDTITEATTTEIDLVYASVSYTLSADVDNLQLTGWDNINATGNGLNNKIWGNSGDNILNGGAGTADILSYELSGAAVKVTLAQTTAQNTLNEGFDTISGFEILVGSNFNDTLTGGAGTAADRLDGGLGTDSMTGGAGNDTYVVNTTADIIVEAAGGGSDTIWSSVTYALNNTTQINVEHLTLTGTGNINGTGHTGNNWITGNTGNNVINGGTGIDVLNGALGNDTLTGGPAGNTDADYFSFSTALNATTNVDTITDFNPAYDVIRLYTAAFTGMTAGNLAAGAFRNGAAALDADDRILYSGGALYFDRDGSATTYGAVKFATVTGSPALTYQDFVVL